MKYIIIGFTSDIDIKTNTAKITYAKLRCLETDEGVRYVTEAWTEDFNKATRLESRYQADEIIKALGYTSPVHAISYGVKD